MQKSWQRARKSMVFAATTILARTLKASLTTFAIQKTGGSCEDTMAWISVRRRALTCWLRLMDGSWTNKFWSGGVRKITCFDPKNHRRPTSWWRPCVVGSGRKSFTHQGERRSADLMGPRKSWASPPHSSVCTHHNRSRFDLGNRVNFPILADLNKCIAINIDVVTVLGVRSGPLGTMQFP